MSEHIEQQCLAHGKHSNVVGFWFFFLTFTIMGWPHSEAGLRNLVLSPSLTAGPAKSILCSLS